MGWVVQGKVILNKEKAMRTSVAGINILSKVGRAADCHLL